MKRIIAIIMISVFLTSSIATVKVQALPVAIAASSASVMAMIIGLIPYLGVLLNSENDRQTNIDNIEHLVTDEMGKTDMTVQELSNWTSANDGTASNGTILQNFLNDNAVMMAMDTGSGENYVQTYFTGVGQAQLFIKAILAMCGAMLVDENLDEYTLITEGTPTGYQQWSGFPNTPVLTSIGLNQCIIFDGADYYLMIGLNLGSDCRQIYGSANPTPYITHYYRFTQYRYNNGVWQIWGNNVAGYYFQTLEESNNDILNEVGGGVFFHKTSVGVQGGTTVETPVIGHLVTAVQNQTSSIWGDTANIAVPSEAIAYDVMEGTRTIGDVTATYTAEGAIPMTGTIAGTLAGTVTAPAEVGEWSKENWTVPTLITTKFPFCIPWDLTNTFTSMIATAEPPSWQIDFPSNIFIGGGSMTIDFAQFETLAKIVRWSTMILFMIGLMLLSWRLKGS